jgi:TDG/mug DNA glycosylase family protein
MDILQDVFQSKLKVVFCGTAAGNRSAQKHAYYAGPGNAFWRTLQEVGFTPSLVSPEAYVSIAKYGLGLTDLAKNAFGLDSRLQIKDFRKCRLMKNIKKYQPQFLAFIGKKAAEEFLGKSVQYGVQKQSIGATRLFVLPSPSANAKKYWDINYWTKLRGMI